MDRTILKRGFSGKGSTLFKCPTCSNNLLKVVVKTFSHEESRESKRMHGSDEWGPENIEYVFSCILKCAGANCGDVVACSGVGYVEQYYDYDEDGHPYPDWDDRFYPKHFNPPLQLIQIPRGTPEDTKSALGDSFSVVFANPASAANHVRVALEHLLTHLKVKRFTISNNKRRPISLHARIESIPAKYAHVKDLCFALKWVGNAGSHASIDVTLDDVLDIYEIFEELLHEIFSNRSKQAKELAKLINKKKGPNRKARITKRSSRRQR